MDSESGFKWISLVGEKLGDGGLRALKSKVRCLTAPERLYCLLGTYLATTSNPVGGWRADPVLPLVGPIIGFPATSLPVGV